MPNALLEAMALGMPCISTDCRPGGARELISSGVNGIIVPCGDVNILADKINEILNSPNEANRLGEAAQNVLAHSNPEFIYSKWESFFLKMIES